MNLIKIDDYRYMSWDAIASLQVYDNSVFISLVTGEKFKYATWIDEQEFLYIKGKITFLLNQKGYV